MATPKELAAAHLARLKGVPDAKPQEAAPAPLEMEPSKVIEAAKQAIAGSARVIEVSPENVNEGRSAYEMLTDRQRLFVDGVLSGKTQTQAIREAGFEGDRPDVAASKMAKLDLVRRALDEERAAAMEAAGVSRFSIRMRLASWVHGDEALDNDGLRVAAAKVLLEELDKHEKSGKGDESVADSIRQRFQRARLINGGAAPQLKLVK